MGFLQDLVAGWDPVALGAALGALGLFALQWLWRTILSIRQSRAETRFNLPFARVDTDRSAAYGEIWTLTGAFNLFGPAAYVDLETLGTRLRDWYFEKGQFLTAPAQDAYKDALEVLTALDRAGISPRRPDEALHGGRKLHDTVMAQELARLRNALARSKGLPEAPALGRGRARARRLTLEMKEALQVWRGEPEDLRILAWLVAQELFSTLRTHLTQDIRSRSRFGRR